MCIAQDWLLLQKEQLYKQMPQPSINSKLFSKKNYVFDRKLLSSNNFKKKPSCASIKKKRQLDLERKIARAQAEEQTYANAELETASIKQPSEIPAHVLPLSLDQQPFSPTKPRPPMAPQETKPFENKYYEDVRLASHLEDSIKESPSSGGSSTGARFLQELIDIQREQQRHNKRLLYLQESRDHQLQELLAQQNKLSLSLTLPSSEVQVFDGDPVNYYNCAVIYKSH